MDAAASTRQTTITDDPRDLGAGSRIYINPSVGGVSLLEWTAFDRVVQLGWESAEEVLSRLCRGVLEEPFECRVVHGWSLPRNLRDESLLLAGHKRTSLISTRS